MTPNKNRIRNRGAFAGESVSFYTESCASYSLNGQYQLGVGKVESMTDQVVSRFKSRRAKGEVFFNPMQQSSTEITSGGGFAENEAVVLTCSPSRHVRHKWVGNWISNFVPYTVVGGLVIPPQNFLLSQSRIDSLRKEVSTTMMSERGRGSDSNLFESLAEMHQTLDMFNRPLERLRNYLEMVARQKRKSARLRNVIDGVSGAYLAYRYGLRPLVSDINSILKGLKETTEKRRRTTRAKAGFKDVSSTNLSWISNVTYLANLSVIDEVKIRAMSLDDVALSTLDNIGLSGKNLLTVPWELVRLSFVLDWFVNVGDFIGAWVPSPLWNQLGSCVTVERSTTSLWSAMGSTGNTSYSVLSPGTGSLMRTDKLKTRMPVDYPSLLIKDNFRFDKATRVGDAFALLAQQMKGIFAASSPSSGNSPGRGRRPVRGLPLTVL